MDKPLVLKTNAEPTYFNKEAAIGFLLFPVVGTIAGAIIGKNRMENERAVGKVIKEPSMFNKDMLLGTLLGGLAGSILFKGLLIAAAATASPALVTAAFGAALISPLIGAYAGGGLGKEAMQQEMVMAQIQQREITPARTRDYDAGINYSQDHAKTLDKQRAQAQEISR